MNKRNVSIFCFGAAAACLTAACHHGDAAASEPVEAESPVTPHHLTWKDVELRDEEPKGCRFVDNLEAESRRLFFTTSHKKVNEKALKKIKMQAAKLGANTIFLTHRDVTMIDSAVEAKAYRCEPTSGAGTGLGSSDAAMPTK